MITHTIESYWIPNQKWKPIKFCNKNILYSNLLYNIIAPLMLETEYSGLGVNTMPADALAPKVARASTGMLLAV